MPADSIIAMLRRNKSILMSHKVRCEWISRGGDPCKVNGGDIISELKVIDTDLRNAEAQVENNGDLIEEILNMQAFNRELTNVFSQIFATGVIPVVNIRDANTRIASDDRLV